MPADLKPAKVSIGSMRSHAQTWAASGTSASAEIAIKIKLVAM